MELKNLLMMGICVYGTALLLCILYKKKQLKDEAKNNDTKNKKQIKEKS